MYTDGLRNVVYAAMKQRRPKKKVPIAVQKKQHKRKTSEKKFKKVCREFDKEANAGHMNPITGTKYQRGHHSILTPQVLKAVSQLIGQGATVSMAAAALEIRPATFKQWLAQGKEVCGWCSATGQSPEERFPTEKTWPVYANLFTVVDGARARFLMEHVSAISSFRNRFGESDWRASSWLLERMGDETLRRADKEAKQRDAQDSSAPMLQPIFMLPTNGRGPTVEDFEKKDAVAAETFSDTEMTDHGLLG